MTSSSTETHATLVFLRHGQSLWNASNQFTGWVDVDLSELGIKEAHVAGSELKKTGLVFDVMFTSYLKRAIKTGNIVLEDIDQLYIPVKKSWRLNERMYGGLQGLNKTSTVEKHGKEQVLKWRRSYDIPPPNIDEKSQYNPKNELKYKNVSSSLIPKTECLKDVIARVLPYWESDIKECLKKGQTVLIAAHGNSIRAILKYLDKIDDSIIPSLEIPTGFPLIYKFDKNLTIIPDPNSVKPLTGKFLGDPETIRKAQEKVKNQISQKKN